MRTLKEIKAKCAMVGHCWIWQGGTDGHGKPTVNWKGRVTNPRRVVRELTDGEPIPPGMQAARTCPDQLCISPMCSVVADSKTRGRLAAERGAFSRPDRLIRMAQTKRAKPGAIPEETIARIRLATGPATRISAETGVSVSHVKAIRRGDARRDYSSPFAGLFTSLLAANDAERKRA